MEIFMLIHLLNYHDTSIGRSDYGFFRISFEQSDGTAEKIDHQQVHYDTYCCHNIKWNPALYPPV